MARVACIVSPGMPHHVTQRGNRRMPTFLQDDDYGVYVDLMKTWCARHKVEIQAYCHINQREGWRGYLWQGRFASFVMDEDYFLTAMRYVELNPVRAGLAASPAEWPWSSARAHLTGDPDPLIGDVREMIDYIGDWERYLALDVEEAELVRLRKHTRTGRPLGSQAFIHRLEEPLGRFLGKRKPGPKGLRKDN